MNATVVLDGHPLSPDQLLAVARHHARVEVSDAVDAAMRATRAVVEEALDSAQVVYGVTTGFGALADTVVPPDEAAALQHALVNSHAAGVGPPVLDEVVRAMTVL